MTNSQVKSWIGGIVAVAAVVELHGDFLAKALPPKYADWVSFAVGLAGIVTAVRNQSTNRDHVSLPVEQAAQLGIDPSLHGGKS
jgi:hypothetical protein